MERQLWQWRGLAGGEAVFFGYAAPQNDYTPRRKKNEPTLARTGGEEKKG